LRGGREFTEPVASTYNLLVSRPQRNRIVVNSSARRPPTRAYRTAPRNREVWIALSVIGAAAFATFLALFLTSRPYDPMTSTFNAQESAPAGGVTAQSSPTPTPTPSAATAQQPTPAATEAEGETASATPDDAAIEAQIERRIKADSDLADVDVSTLVEGGRVTVVGSVRSTQLKQRVERLIRAINGVVAVDNQVVVIEATPQ
jgi:hypothetical protein